MSEARTGASTGAFADAGWALAAYRKACATLPEGCGRWALLRESRSKVEPRSLLPDYSRACDGDVGWACARAGHLEHAAGNDSAAFQLFSRACRLGAAAPPCP